MKVLTLHQPWATLIALGVKTIETRPQQTNVRGRIAIHAAARPPDALCLGPYTIGLLDPRPATRRMWHNEVFGAVIDLPLGAIVATANLVDCIPMIEEHPAWDGQPYLHVGVDLTLIRPWCGRARRADIVTHQRPYGHFARGRWAWILADIEPLVEPVPFKGGQGWSKSWEPQTADLNPSSASVSPADAPTDGTASIPLAAPSQSPRDIADQNPTQQAERGGDPRTACTGPVDPSEGLGSQQAQGADASASLPNAGTRRRVRTLNHGCFQIGRSA